ncbi:MAG TPA: aminotransferase class III-fold pyridoxal phosphate-dependent enzyme [Rectinemataceae bacterium]|nr:aminotransferase class III-fold pyridoxal phosphate-dependent enzyme [Rectinemataceae bacterium]
MAATEFPRLRLDKSMAMFADAQRLSPGGVMGIRRPYNFVQGEYPIFLDRGYGGHIVDVDGNDYIDMLCGYGPIILGYEEREINEAVAAQMGRGFCFALVQPVQNQLEERLTKLIPCAEQAILVKTGSDATTLAVRIARGYTDRKVILRCGYHGWHDWCVEVKGGVPEDITDLTVEFEYGKLDELEAKLEEYKGRVAGIIVTPVGHPNAHPVVAPPSGYLEGVRELATAHGAVLIFDEVRTGFRVSMGGAQERYGVTPDLGTFGKALANGYAISAVAGKREFMQVAEKKVFVSSTFFPNSLEMVAAMKCLDILEREKVPESIWARGTVFLERLRKIVADSKVPCSVSGIPPMPYITFDQAPGEGSGTPGEKVYKARREYFYTQTIRRGLFVQPYHHWYIAHRHTEADLEKALAAIAESLELTAARFPVK